MQGPAIYIVSPSEFANSILINELQPLRAESLGVLELIAIHPDEITVRFNKAAKVAILNMPRWGNDCLAAIGRIRKTGFKGPILVFGKNQFAQVIADAPQIEGVGFIEKPVGSDWLVDFLRNLVAQPRTALRAQPRYETLQDATVALDGEVWPTSCKLTNISKGGACLRFQNVIPFNSGSVVSLQLGPLMGAHTFRGQVAWANGNNLEVGVRFLNEGVSRQAL